MYVYVELVFMQVRPALGNAEASVTKAGEK